MKINLTPSALTQLELLAHSGTEQTGFITGQTIGRFKIIEGLFPMNFNETTITDVYANTYYKLGDKLIGVFFNHCEPFFCDWFLESIILKIKDPQPEFYFYNITQESTLLTEVGK